MLRNSRFFHKEKAFRMNAQNLTIFYGLSDEEIEKSLHCSRGKVISSEKGQMIYRQEDEPTRLYFVLEGSVELGSCNALGKLTRIRVLREGECFGETELFLAADGYNSYARAMTRVRLLSVPEEFFGGQCDRCCMHHSKVVYNMLHVFAEKSDQDNRQIDLLTLGSLKQRVAAFLLEESETQQSGSGMVSLSLNREELAAFLNTTRPSLSRMLQQMQEEGLLRIVSRSQIEITDEEGLKATMD